MNHRHPAACKAMRCGARLKRVSRHGEARAMTPKDLMEPALAEFDPA